jgi:hypothetical protein
MDLVSLALSFLMQNPNGLMAGAQHFSRPGAIDVAQMKTSFADLSRGILNCYHRTARYQAADVVQQPWSRQGQYGADKSAIIRIRYFGVTSASYQITVALLGKGNALRTAVLQDTALVPYSKKCELEQWTSG